VFARQTVRRRSVKPAHDTNLRSVARAHFIGSQPERATRQMQQGGRGGGSSRNGRRRSNNSNGAGNGHKCGAPQMGSWAAPGERPAGLAGELGASQPAPGEYYGSMAAGSIVGAASRCARQGTYTGVQPGEPTRVQPRNHGRRARHAPSEGKGPAVSCRAQLVHRHEGWLLSAEGALSAPTATEGAAQADVKPIRRWFCLTTNAFSAYSGPSKITNVGVVALRAVRSFGWISQAGEHHITLQVLRMLPAGAPPPLRGEPAGGVDETAAACWEVRLSLPPKEEPLAWHHALSTVLPCTTSPPLGSPRDLSGPAPTGIGAMRRPASTAPAATQVVQVPVPVPVPVPMVQTQVIPVPMSIPLQATAATLPLVVVASSVAAAPPLAMLSPTGSSVASPLLGSVASQSAREQRASQPARLMLMFMSCVCSRLIPSLRHGRCHSRLVPDRSLRRSGLVCEREDGRDPQPRSNCRAGRGRCRPCGRDPRLRTGRDAASLCDTTGNTAACSAHPHTGAGPERRSRDDP